VLASIEASGKEIQERRHDVDDQAHERHHPGQARVVGELLDDGSSSLEVLRVAHEYIDTVSDFLY
jgi:hypothetical protein